MSLVTLHLTPAQQSALECAALDDEDSPIMTRQGNPKTSKWRSTPNAARVNKNVMLTLPPDEREKLDRLAKAWGCPRSVAVARLVREAKEPAE